MNIARAGGLSARASGTSCDLRRMPFACAVGT